MLVKGDTPGCTGTGPTPNAPKTVDRIVSTTKSNTSLTNDLTLVVECDDDEETNKSSADTQSNKSEEVIHIPVISTRVLETVSEEQEIVR